MSLVPRLTLALLLFALISGFTIYISPRTTVPKAATAKAIPSDEELRRLTTDTLLAFDRAVQARDFTAFHASVAELWKRQITPEELAEAFEPFISNQVSIAGVKDVAPVFHTPPEINEQGLVVVSGYVPTEPLLVRFTLTYTYEHPAWKLFGIQVNVEDGDYDKAIADYDEAIRLDPEDATAYASRAFCYDNKGEYEKAIADYTEAIRLDPRDPEAYNNRGCAYDEMGEYDKAIADYDEAIRLDPKDAVAYSNRGRAYFEKGKYDRAIADCTEAIRLDLNNPLRYKTLAWLLATCPKAKHRDGRKAIETATQACELTQWTDAACLDTLAAGYAEAGQFEEAIKRQTKAIELLPADSHKTALESRLELYKAGKPYREAQ